MIVCRTDVPGMRHLPLQGRAIRPVREALDAGGGVAVIGHRSERLQRAGKEGEVLLVGDFESGDVRVGSIDFLRHRNTGKLTGRRREQGLDQGRTQLLEEDPGNLFQIFIWPHSHIIGGIYIYIFFGLAYYLIFSQS